MTADQHTLHYNATMPPVGGGPMFPFQAAPGWGPWAKTWLAGALLQAPSADFLVPMRGLGKLVLGRVNCTLKLSIMGLLFYLNSTVVV